MPVVKIFFDRFTKMVGNVRREMIVDRLPYLGLDIESVDEESIRLEYNPNRPDFSTDYGIARALRGLMGIETGLPKYRVRIGKGERGGEKMEVLANPNLSRVRPYISCAVARNIQLDDETIRQLISMQEDLHNGLGRKRRRVAIGFHNLDFIRPPIYYEGKPGSFSFIPLGESREMTIQEVLRETETGRSYGHLLSRAQLYPVLRDSNGMVLSFPPIINGTTTRVDTGTRNIFIDITSTDELAGQDTLAVIVAALADARATLESVRIKYSGKSRITPALDPTRMRLDMGMVRKITGLDATASQVRTYLRRCRLDVSAANQVIIPRYRVDILHPVDIAEEVAIGLGLDRFTPLYPPSYEAGNLDAPSVSLDRASEIMARSGFTEAVNYELVDEVSLYSNFSRGGEPRVEVENPRSLEHYLLRDSIMPSLMAVLRRNIKEEYPQKIFEVGKVYRIAGETIKEEHHLGAVIAHAASTYSEAKMHLSALAREYTGSEASTRAGRHWAFADGRCAEVLFGGKTAGYVGEVKPAVIASFGLGVAVSAFEIDLAKLI